MKILQLIGGREFTIEDDEAENIMRAAETSRFIRLRNGAFINTTSISNIAEPEKVASWHQYPLSKDGKSFMRDGKRVYLEPQSFREIEYIDDPKYTKKEETPLIQ